MKISRVMVALFFAMQSGSAQAVCCQLTKIDADPSSTQVRVCEASAPAECTTWLYEGSLTEGQTVPICAASGSVIYQELLPSTETYAPPIEARCDAGGRIEI